jgi:hypothetical protein
MMSSSNEEGMLVKPGSSIIFISHSHDDRAFAVELKNALRIIGFQGFVAHMDIEPTHDWEEEILKALRSCVTLIVITSDQAKSSPWVNHEIGAGAVLDKPALSISHGCAPWTLISHNQALSWELPPPGLYIGPREALKKNIDALCHSLEKLGVVTVRHLIEGLGSCRSFNESEAVVSVIERESQSVGGLSMDEADRLAYLASINNQVSNSHGAQRTLPILLSPFKDRLNPQVLDMLDSQGITI